MVMLALSIKISCQTRYVRFNEMHIAQKQGRYMKKALHTAKDQEISDDFFVATAIL